MSSKPQRLGRQPPDRRRSVFVRWLASAAALPLLVAQQSLAQSADEAFAECEAQVTAAPAAYDSYLCFYLVGARQRALDVAAESLERIADRGRSPWARLVRAHIAYGSGQSDEAVRLYEETARVAEQQQVAEAAVIARTNLRTLLLAAGRSAEAAEQAGLALTIAEETGEEIALMRASVLQAQHVVDTSRNLQPAITALERARALAFPEGPLGLQSSILLFLADAYFDVGQFDRAISVYEDLRDHKLSNNDPTELSTIDFNLINIRLTQLERLPEEAARSLLLDETEAALARALEGEQWAIGARLAGTLADLLRRDRPDQARTRLEQCSSLASRIVDPKPAIHCAWSTALLLRTEEGEQALQWSRAALDQARAAESSLFLAYAARAHLRVVWAALDPQRALDESASALDAVEALRDAQDETLRAELFATWTSDYHFLVGQLLARDMTEEALLWIERMRARSLREALLRTSGRAGPTSRSLLSASAVQETLADGEELLLWSFGHERDIYGDEGGGSWLLNVRKDRLTAIRLASRADLLPVVRVGAEQVHSDRLTPQSAATVHEALFRHWRPASTTGRLVMVPDDLVSSFPLAAVDLSAASPLRGMSWSYVPSLELWSQWRQQDQFPVGVSGPRWVFGAPDRSASGRLAPEATRETFAPLPYARAEAKEAAARTGGKRFLDEQASIENLRKVVAQTSGGVELLHLATHAFSDSQDPSRSAVALASAEPEGGLLRAAEITDLQLGGATVILSGCETSSGPLVRGEGALSLARAFLQAGARAVIATRWAVRDREARRFVEYFYDALAGTDSVDSALRLAQLRAREEALPLSTWAAFELYGDGTTELQVRRSRFARTARPWLVGTLLAALAALMVRTRQRH